MAEKADLTNIVGAGVMLIVIAGTITGVYQIAKAARAIAPQATTAAPEQSQPPPQIELPPARSETQRPLPKNAKCVGGVIFATIDGELRNVGHCP